jgi:hypothetical protein
MEVLAEELRVHNDSHMLNRETPPGFKMRGSYVLKRGGEVVNIR